MPLRLWELGVDAEEAAKRGFDLAPGLLHDNERLRGRRPARPALEVEGVEVLAAAPGEVEVEARLQLGVMQ